MSVIGPEAALRGSCRAHSVDRFRRLHRLIAVTSRSSRRQKLEQSRSLGFGGIVTVHPKSLDAWNACFTPSPEALAGAQEIVNAFE
ncbi:MAG: hypothetical protein ABI580_02565 [Burkholderiaceae bacterium]